MREQVSTMESGRDILRGYCCCWVAPELNILYFAIEYHPSMVKDFHMSSKRIPMGPSKPQFLLSHRFSVGAFSSIFWTYSYFQRHLHQ